MDESCCTEPLMRNASCSETRSEFCCTKLPFLIWELDKTASFQITIVVTSIAYPAIVLLNLVVILAVKTRHELRKTSTILLCSLAVADLLAGALPMPLTIALDALVLQERPVTEKVFCPISYANEFLMCTTWGASFFHLLVIAWERYVAVHKWREYRTIVTTRRLRKYAAIAWLASLMTVLFIMMPYERATGVPNEVIFYAHFVLGIAIILCLFLIGYFYVKVHRGIRKWNRSQIRQVNALIKWKREANIALMTFWITVFASISTLPYLSILIFRRTSPFFSKSSFFRSSETLLQLNSLLNPIFYFYRNHRFRRAALEVLKIRKPQKIQAQARSV